MSDFDFGQTIKYKDGTRDLNFEAAKRWALNNGASFSEDVKKRRGLIRCFKIGDKPVYRELSENELKHEKKEERNNILNGWLNDKLERYERQKAANLQTTDSDVDYKAMLLYAQYLRDVPQQDGDWWNQPILNFEDWRRNADL